MTYEIKTEQELRDAFWQGNLDKHIELYHCLTGKPLTQNEYNATIRIEWCEFVDMMEKDGLISETLANNATL
jgi:hypothetical protein